MLSAFTKHYFSGMFHKSYLKFRKNTNAESPGSLSIAHPLSPPQHELGDSLYTTFLQFQKQWNLSSYS